mgnify:CR=1 FL=1
MMTNFSIQDRPIGSDHHPYVIAELSANHNGSIETALNIIQKAHESGADAVKLQTYRPETITLNSDRPDFRISEGLWKDRTLWDLYQWAHTPWEWHQELFNFAGQLGIPIFSSPFDKTAVDLLEDLNTPAYKVASFEIIDLPLIRYIAATGKPMIISTGMADNQEILEALETARDGGCTQIALLHCVSGYPAPASDYNLRTIPDMAERFGTVIGLSDHTLDNATAIASIALGAVIIEKHVTLDRSGDGPDDSFSLEPLELKALCRDTRTAWEALGRINYERKESEKSNVKFRRSLYFVRDMKTGQEITSADVRSVRPGYGLPPKYLKILLGKKMSKPARADTPTSFDFINENS